MEFTNLKKRLVALPDAVQREVTDLISALEVQYTASRSPSPASLCEKPFIGWWAGLDDLADSTAWVRRTR